MLLKADARRIPLRDETVQCVVTSPPYWGLRDYGLPPSVWGGDANCEHEWQPEWFGCLGLEPTPELYVRHIVEVFREVRRVLRKDGTLWLNLGDSYAGSWGNYGGQGGPNGQRPKATERFNRPAYADNDRRPPQTASHGFLKSKDLIGIPWRVAFALQEDGWWLRSDIIWAKPNPMPESVTDRPTRSHEYLFLLTKSARYYYDAEAIREPSVYPEDDRKGRAKTFHKFSADPRMISGMRPRKPDKQRGHANDRWDAMTKQEQCSLGRNKRSVWRIATQPYSGAHFATFPEKLVEPCILAGTSEKGCCPECGSPWERVVEASGGLVSGGTKKSTLGSSNGRLTNILETKGWRPTCDHKEEPNPCVVLDPFVGSGTTVRVAKKLNRTGIGIDLAYQDIAIHRTSNVQRRFRHD